MSTVTDALVIIGMFALRIGVPLAVIAALAYGLKRLDRRWEEEARAQRGVTRPVEQPLEQPALRPEVSQPTSQPGIQAGIAGEQPPLDPVRVRQPELVNKANGNRHS